jgi:hypothetical protein
MHTAVSDARMAHRIPVDSRLSTLGSGIDTARHRTEGAEPAHNGCMFSLVSGALQMTTAAAGKVIETAATAATIPVRAVALIGQTELLVNRITLAVSRAEELIERVTAVATTAESTVAEARAITTAAAIAVDEVAAIATRASSAVDGVSSITIRADTAVGEVTALTTRAHTAVDAADAIVTRANTAVDAAGAIVTRADTTVGEVTAIVTRANSVAGEVESLVGDYSPTLRQAAPLAARFVSELTPDEVTAAIRMIDELPALQRHLVHDVMPLLGKLDQVGPDLHKLLEVTEDLHLAIAGLPGLKMLRRRGEERTHD